MTAPLTPAQFKKLRLKARISQARLASRLGVRHPRIVAWETGKEPIGITEEELVAALSVPGWRLVPRKHGAVTKELRSSLRLADWSTGTIRQEAERLQRNLGEALRALDELLRGDGGAK